MLTVYRSIFIDLVVLNNFSNLQENSTIFTIFERLINIEIEYCKRTMQRRKYSRTIFSSELLMIY